jgi:predicted lysophospholipase L1 biosynthesis ABC-type transport system permease subunit
MDALVVGAAFVGSCATAFVVQRAVLSAMLRALRRGKPMRSGFSPR